MDYADLHAPEKLGDLAAQFEATRFICTGAAWSDLPAALELLRAHSNILLDTSLIHTCGTLEAIVRTYGAGRLVFGLGHRTNGDASIAEVGWMSGFNAASYFIRVFRRQSSMRPSATRPFAWDLPCSSKKPSAARRPKCKMARAIWIRAIQ